MSEKDQAPTDPRLREARKKGQIAVSAEVVHTAGFAGALVCLLVDGPAMVQAGGALIRRLIGHAVRAGSAQGSSTLDILHDVMFTVSRICLPPLVIGALVAVAAGFVQTRGLLSFDQLEPKAERVDPIEGFKRIFSLRSALQLLKLVVFTLVISLVLTVIYRDLWGDMMRSSFIEIDSIGALTWHLATRLLIAGLLVALLMAVADYLIMWFTFMREMRMSKDDLREEYKNLEGDPHIKGRRKADFRELVEGSAREKIAKAKVIVANPTHVAIAIHYEPGEIDLPLVALKGLDDQAVAIREYAESIGVPVYEDRELARSLYRDCVVDGFIGKEYFAAIAEVFKWLAKLEGARAMAERAREMREAQQQRASTAGRPPAR